MIQVHNTFVCKPGNAGKLAKLIKENMPFDPVKGPYVLTDMTGQFHRVIMISNHADLTAYEKDTAESMADTPENKKMMEAFKDMNDMYVSGTREIYKVW
jgi:hypothetical protein